MKLATITTVIVIADALSLHGAASVSCPQKFCRPMPGS
jgi:hypothetical protein